MHITFDGSMQRPAACPGIAAAADHNTQVMQLNSCSSLPLNSGSYYEQLGNKHAIWLPVPSMQVSQTAAFSDSTQKAYILTSTAGAVQSQRRASRQGKGTLLQLFLTQALMVLFVPLQAICWRQSAVMHIISASSCSVASTDYVAHQSCDPVAIGHALMAANRDKFWPQ